MSGTAGKREPLLWRRAAPRVSVCLARAPGESKRCERPQGASMYGDGVKYPHTVSEYWIQAGASMRILNTGLARYPKSIRVSMRLPGTGRFLSHGYILVFNTCKILANELIT